MTNDQIIEMAKQSGIEFDADGSNSFIFSKDQFIAFARLIEKQVKEECAKEVDDFRKRRYNNECDISVAHDCAAAIRNSGGVA